MKIDEVVIKRRYDLAAPFLNEKTRRAFAGAEARAAGWGGITAVQRATGLARMTFAKGAVVAAGASAASTGRIRGALVAAARPTPRNTPRRSRTWYDLRSLVRYAVLLHLISTTTTMTGPQVRRQPDDHEYPTRTVGSDAEMEALNIQTDDFHGKWDYTISPRKYQSAYLGCARPLSAFGMAMGID